MSDEPRPQDNVEQRLGLVARGVQRMADAFGSLEQRLSDLADAERLQALSDRVDEYRVRNRSEVAQLAERIERLDTETTRAIELLRIVGETLDRDDRGLANRIDAIADRRPPWVDELNERMLILEHRIADGPAVADSGTNERLIEAVRGLRDDIAVAIGELRVETTAHIERVLTEQGSRLIRVQDAIRGEVVGGTGQLRTDIASDQAALRDRLVEEVSNALRATTPAGADAERLAAIENVIASLRDELAIDRLETSMRSMGSDLEKVVEDTTGLRADVKKSFERVLFTINSAEESLTGEVRAIDHRLSGMADDVRLVRGLRDSLEALASGVDSVRQLASRSATSSQMAELTRDLSTVLAEIETARSQVLTVDQQVGLVQAGAIDVGGPANDEVTRTVEHLERAVTDEIGDLGRRIEELAESVIAQPPVVSEPPELTDQIAKRLRSLASSARQLGLGMAEDMRARRGSRRR